MSVKINKSILGNNKNNTLENKNESGYVYMAGKKGDDTYVINNISATATSIYDTAGKDTLTIKASKASDITALFDVVYNEPVGGPPADELYFITKSNAYNIANQMGKFIKTRKYNDIPPKGLVEIDYYFGNTNNLQSNGKYGTKYGAGYIENIYTKDSEGAKYLIDVKNYVAAVTPKVRNFLKSSGYNSSTEVLLCADTTTKNNLLNIYKNTAMKYRITGSKNSDKLYGGNANDKILASSGNDIIKAYAGNDYIEGGTGKDTIYAGSGNDTIKGGADNDKIFGEAGDDKIYGNKGNDIIKGGSGNNLIYFAKYDGSDTIINGGGNDTLVFTNEKLSNIKAKYSKNDVVLTYTGGQITLKDYISNGHSANYIQVGKTKKAIEDLLPYNKTIKRSGKTLIGTNKKDYLKSTESINTGTIKTYNGNDKIEIYSMDTNVFAGKGNDTIINKGSGSAFKLYAGDGNDTVKVGKDIYYTMFDFVNEKNITGLKLTNTKNGFKITYNGGKDSVNVVMDSATYSNWVNDASIYDYTLKVNKEYYSVIDKSIVKLYTPQILRVYEEINTKYAYDMDTLTTSSGDDFIRDITAKKINALAGDDYISVFGFYDDFKPMEINAGKGNDIIDSYGANLYFQNGDGHDYVTNSYNSFFFTNSNPNDINIYTNSQDLVIKYNNNKDSVTIDTYFSYYYGDIQVNIDDKNYCVMDTGDYYRANTTGLIASAKDDIIDYNVSSDFWCSEIYTGYGNDVINIIGTCSQYPIYSYFNVNSEGELDDNALYLSFNNNPLNVMDYFSKGTTEIQYSEMGKKLDLSNIDSIKSAVASWLGDNSEYSNVIAAITDEVNGADNFIALMGEEYFGSIQWQ